MQNTIVVDKIYTQMKEIAPVETLNLYLFLYIYNLTVGIV
jgi:hypothetical protein